MSSSLTRTALPILTTGISPICIRRYAPDLLILRYFATSSAFNIRFWTLEGGWILSTIGFSGGWFGLTRIRFLTPRLLAIRQLFHQEPRAGTH
jgi:hypothetical protein